MELRKYTCAKCGMSFYVDCDDSDYPVICPFGCDYTDEITGSDFIKSEETIRID